MFFLLTAIEIRRTFKTMKLLESQSEVIAACRRLREIPETEEYDAQCAELAVSIETAARRLPLDEAALTVADDALYLAMTLHEREGALNRLGLT